MCILDLNEHPFGLNLSDEIAIFILSGLFNNC